MIRRTFPIAARVLGIAGLLTCAVLLFTVWLFTAQVKQMTNSLFTSIDKSLLAVKDRIEHVEERVQELKLGVEDVEKEVTDWAKAEAGDRLRNRIELDERIGDQSARIAAGLENVYQLLQMTQSSVALIAEGTTMINSVGASLETERVDRLLEEIELTRGELQRLLQSVEDIQKRFADSEEEDIDQSRIEQITRITARMMATFTTFDDSLDATNDRIEVLQAQTSEAGVRLNRWINLVAIVLSLIILWMAAGQAALCYVSRRKPAAVE